MSRANYRRSILHVKAARRNGQDEESAKPFSKLPAIISAADKDKRPHLSRQRSKSIDGRTRSSRSSAQAVMKAGKGKDGVALDPTTKRSRDNFTSQSKRDTSLPSSALLMERQRSLSFDDSTAVANLDSSKSETASHENYRTTTGRSLHREPLNSDRNFTQKSSSERNTQSEGDCLPVKSPRRLNRLRSNSFDDRNFAKKTSSERNTQSEGDCFPVNYPRRLNRLRSQSFDSVDKVDADVMPLPMDESITNGMLRGMLSGKAQQLQPLNTKLDPPCAQSVERHVNEIYNSTKVFWRCRITARILIFYHVERETFEVVAYNTRNQSEMGRVYVTRSALAAHVDNSNDLHGVKIHRRDLIEQAMQHCSAEYIASILEANADGSSLHLRAYDESQHKVVDMTTPKPKDLAPMPLNFSNEMTIPVDSKRTEQILEELEIYRADMAASSSKASEESARMAEVLAQIAVLKPRWFPDGEVINPNIYNLARWRWVWSIERIKLVNRVAYTIASLWKRAAQGKLQLDQMISETSRGHRYDERIYVALNAEDGITFQVSDDFRKLRFDNIAVTRKHNTMDGSALYSMFESFDKSKTRRRETRKETVTEKTKVLAGHDMRDDVRLSRRRRREEEKMIYCL